MIAAVVFSVLFALVVTAHPVEHGTQVDPSYVVDVPTTDGPSVLQSVLKLQLDTAPVVLPDYTHAGSSQSTAATIIGSLDWSDWLCWVALCLYLALFVYIAISALKAPIYVPVNDAERALIEQFIFLNFEPLESPKQSTPSNHPDEKPGLLFRDVEPKRIETSDAFNEKHELLADQDTLGVEEKYHDAQSFPSPLIPHIHIHPDPDLLPLPTLSEAPTPYSTPPSTPPRTLRRIPSHLSIASPTKPAWSLRASASPSLGLSTSPSMRAVSPEPVSIPIPGAYAAADERLAQEDTAAAVRAPPRRAYRAPMPELDLAFALQLRPGLGLGADSAWVVRFLMAMFGWMTVFVGGSANAGGGRRMIAAV